MNEIVNFISNLEAPIINGVVYPSGDLTLLDIQINWDLPIKYKVLGAFHTTVNDFVVKNDLYFSSCTITSHIVCNSESIEIFAGEGSYGSDGFVAVADSGSKKLIWLAFFECSNPFIDLTIKGKVIYATSTLNCLWMFDIDNPSKVTIKCGD